MASPDPVVPRVGPQSARRPALRFGLTFMLLAGTLSLAYAYSYPPGSALATWFQRYLEAYAQAAGALLSLLDPSVHVQGAQILGRYPLWIVKDCDAMEVKILFTAAVLAFPSTWRSKAFGVIVGVFALFVANLVRIATLYFVGVHAPDSFESAHREIWPLILVGTALGLFAIWVRWAGRPDRKGMILGS